MQFPLKGAPVPHDLEMTTKKFEIPSILPNGVVRISKYFQTSQVWKNSSSENFCLEKK